METPNRYIEILSRYLFYTGDSAIMPFCLMRFCFVLCLFLKLFLIKHSILSIIVWW